MERRADRACRQGFTLNRKLRNAVRATQRRRSPSKGIVDWGTAESLAFASLLTAGTPIRLTGQDTERGTFSHRHAVFARSVADGSDVWIPLQHLAERTRLVRDSQQSALRIRVHGLRVRLLGASSRTRSCSGRRSTATSSTAREIVVDQFIAAGQAKWGQTSRLTLLLPHGYEGGGPEHSSARLERFLQLVAEGQSARRFIRRSASNYYHLLRMQGAIADRGAARRHDAEIAVARRERRGHARRDGAAAVSLR